ncbi:MAG: hypothetical protein IK061_07405, partial [Desulfovibrio sp.]|nr:hypothetical protein [Desulfovibrio sp.]
MKERLVSSFWIFFQKSSHSYIFLEKFPKTILPPSALLRPCRWQMTQSSPPQRTTHKAQQASLPRARPISDLEMDSSPRLLHIALTLIHWIQN